MLEKYLYLMNACLYETVLIYSKLSPIKCISFVYLC